MDERAHLQTRLRKERAEQTARESNIQLHNIAVQFIRGDTSRKELRRALDAADSANAAAKRANEDYTKSWNQIVDATVGTTTSGGD